MRSGEKSLASLRFSVGAHMASAVEKRLPYDIGMGYVLKTGKREDRDPDALDETPPLILYHGGYLEGLYGFQVGEEKWSRGWVGARGEIVTQSGWGLIGRLAWESTMYIEGGGGDGKNKGIVVGGAIGRLGYGVFFEGGYQSLSVKGERFEGVVLSAGLTLRFPAFAFAALVFP